LWPVSRGKFGILAVRSRNRREKLALRHCLPHNLVELCGPACKSACAAGSPVRTAAETGLFPRNELVQRGLRKVKPCNGQKAKGPRPRSWRSATLTPAHIHRQKETQQHRHTHWHALAHAPNTASNPRTLSRRRMRSTSVEPIVLSCDFTTEITSKLCLCTPEIHYLDQSLDPGVHGARCCATHC